MINTVDIQSRRSRCVQLLQLAMLKVCPITLAVETCHKTQSLIFWGDTVFVFSHTVLYGCLQLASDILAVVSFRLMTQS